MIGDVAPWDWTASARELAPRLLGGTVVVLSPEGSVAVRLTDVEAYEGANDPASHAARGRTARNAAMFGPPGRLYVYLSYGLHCCLNLVTNPDGVPGAVLLRGGIVTDGVALATRRRGARRPLAQGPGRLGQALGVGLDLNHTPLGGLVRFVPGDPLTPTAIRSGPRIGISRGRDLPWRFWLDEQPGLTG